MDEINTGDTVTGEWPKLCESDIKNLFWGVTKRKGDSNKINSQSCPYKCKEAWDNVEKNFKRILLEEILGLTEIENPDQQFQDKSLEDIKNIP